MSPTSGKPEWQRLNGAGVAVLALGLIVAGVSMPLPAEADRYDSLVRKGTHQVRKGQFGKAIKLFKEAVREDPAESWGYFNVGNIARKAKKCRDVLIYFRAFLYLSPGTDDDKIARSAIKTCAREPATGSLSVATEPTGAEILLDGVVIGQSKESEIRLTAGTYRLELSHPNVEGFSREITVTQGEETLIKETLRLKPAFGFLAVKVDPPDGVKVYLDEKPMGVTPKDVVRLETRKYLLRLEKAGYDRWIRNVTIRKDRTYTLQATLEKLEETPPATPAER